MASSWQLAAAGCQSASPRLRGCPLIGAPASLWTVSQRETYSSIRGLFVVLAFQLKKVANLIRNFRKTTRKRLKFYMNKVIEKFKLWNLILWEIPHNKNNIHDGGCSRRPTRFGLWSEDTTREQQQQQQLGNYNYLFVHVTWPGVQKSFVRVLHCTCSSIPT